MDVAPSASPSSPERDQAARPTPEIDLRGTARTCVCQTICDEHRDLFDISFPARSSCTLRLLTQALGMPRSSGAAGRVACRPSTPGIAPSDQRNDDSSPAAASCATSAWRRPTSAGRTRFSLSSPNLSARPPMIYVYSSVCSELGKFSIWNPLE